MANVKLEGVESVRTMLARLGGTLQEAQRLAQNKMAYEIWRAEKDQMKSDLDRPTPWSVNAIRYKKASHAETNLGDIPATQGAAVYMANAFRAGSRVGPDEWLGVQVVGGQTAGPRRSEKLLQNAGILPPGKVWVPAQNVKLNRYGNVEGGVIARILMDLGQNEYVATDRADAKIKTKAFALFGPKNNPIGVLAKIGDTWYPYLYFVDRAAYKPRYDFYGRGDREAEAKWKAIYDEAVQKALEKAGK